MEMGCIMADLFMVLMYFRGAHLSVSVYTWLERMEISCEVNMTFLSVSPLSFTLSVAPSFGIFLRLCARSDRELGLGKVLGSSSISVGWQRAISKEKVFLDPVPWTRISGECLQEGDDCCWCLLNLIKKRTYHCKGIWKQLQFVKRESCSWNIC